MSFDLLSFGRCSMDLYSKQIGSKFSDIESFSAYIGGSPTNISVSAQRLGLKTALLSAVGDDLTGKFITDKLIKENVNTANVFILPNTKTNLVLCGVIPPDQFPLVFYREKAPENKITIGLIEKINLDVFKALLICGTTLSESPCRDAAIHLSDKAKQKNIPVILDIDFRLIAWKNLEEYSKVITNYIKITDILIGTEEEILSVYLKRNEKVEIKNDSITQPKLVGDLNNAIDSIFKMGTKLIILKKGVDGCVIYESKKKAEKVPSYKVNAVNILGAGDAFAAGFIFGYLHGWSNYKSCRLANACGAWLVTKNGCCNVAPTFEEISVFIESNGGY